MLNRRNFLGSMTVSTVALASGGIGAAWAETAKDSPLGAMALSKPSAPSAEMSALAEEDYRTILEKTGHLPRIDKLEIYPLPADIIVERNVRIPMPDGVTLSANVYRPRGTAKVPVVFTMTRYNKEIGPEKYMPGNSIMRQAMGTGSSDLRSSEHAAYEGPDPAFWVPHGYACVLFDARGTGLSGGKDAWLTAQLGDDYASAIGWAADQPWSNGKVGLNGVSYLCIASYHGASRHPRGLAAMIAWEGLSDMYRDLAYHGGIPETGFYPWWRADPRPAMPGSFDPPETVEEGSPTFAEATRNFWNPLNPADIEVPLLQCGSWSDQGLHSRGSFNIFNGASSKEKWLFTHGRDKWNVYSNDEEALEWQLAFFDRFLKGKKNAMNGKPRVRLEVRKTRTEFEARGEASWPPAGTRFEPFYLEPVKGHLTKEAPAAAASTSYASTMNRPAIFIHTFDKDTELSGPAALKLWVSTDAGEDMDLFVGLRKFDIAGAEVHFSGRENDVHGIVSNGWLRVTQRKLDPAQSRPERPYLAHDGELPVVPGQIYEVDIEILPSSTLFEAGSRLMLNVGGREMFSNRLCQHRKLRNKGVHTIHTGAATASRLLLPVVERG